MTHNLTFLKLSTLSLLCLSVSACHTAPQNGIVKTDLSGSMSQMWSNVFTGELRRAPDAHYNFGQNYAFGGTDATLNTGKLMSRVAVLNQPQYQYQPQMAHATPQPQYGFQSTPKHNIEKRVSSPRVNSTPSTVEPTQYTTYQNIIDRQERRFAPQQTIEPASSRRSFGSKLKSIFTPKNTSEGRPLSTYESFEPKPKATASRRARTSAALTRPAQSRPIIDTSAKAREAYPTQSAVSTKAQYDIPRRASIDENLKAMGRRTAALDPIATASSQGPAANWQAANQEIGDSLSYVKMGGESQISDWQACEKQAGQYFQTTATGFIVDPAFDQCMRASGYKPEAEAQSELELSAN